MQTKVSQYERNCSLNVARGRLTDYNVTSVSTSNAISIFIAVFDGRNTVPGSRIQCCEREEANDRGCLCRLDTGTVFLPSNTIKTATGGAAVVCGSPHQFFLKTIRCVLHTNYCAVCTCADSRHITSRHTLHL